MGHHQAVRALAFKWIRILYRCWNERKMYDELHYLSMLKRRGSNLWTRSEALNNKATTGGSGKVIAEHPEGVKFINPSDVDLWLTGNLR